MPLCHLTHDFLKYLNGQRPDRSIHYSDKDLPGFLLEFRPSGNGTWYFRYRNVHGRLRYCRLGKMATLEPMEARIKAYELYKALLDGKEPKVECQLPSSIPTLEDFVIRHYLPHAQVNKRSWKTDESMLRCRILPVFGKSKLNTIRRLDVVNWMNGMRKKGLVPGSCNRTLALLRFIFNCAIRWDMLSAGSNPCREVSPFEDNGAREYYLSPEEGRKLLNMLESIPRQSANAIKLLLFTGARKSEILHSRWENLDLERRLLTVPLSKSGKTRHIPLSDEAIKILREIPRWRDNPWIFPNSQTGRPLQSIFRTWNTLRQRLNMPEIRLHDLRHSFASFLVNSGCSLYEVQKILGHYDPKVTMRYAHLSSGALVQAANMVGIALGNKDMSWTK